MVVAAAGSTCGCGRGGRPGVGPRRRAEGSLVRAGGVACRRDGGGTGRTGSGAASCLGRCCGDASPVRNGGDACLEARGGDACLEARGGDACRRCGDAWVAAPSGTRVDPMASPAACVQAAAAGSAASWAAKLRHCCICRRSERVRGGAAAGPPRPPTSCWSSATSSASCCRCFWLRAVRWAMSASSWPAAREIGRASRVASLLVPSLPCASSLAAAAAVASRSAVLTSSLSAAMWTCEHCCFRVMTSSSILHCAAPRVLASVRPSARLRAVRHCCSCLRSRGVGEV